MAQPGGGPPLAARVKGGTCGGIFLKILSFCFNQVSLNQNYTHKLIA